MCCFCLCVSFRHYVFISLYDTWDSVLVHPAFSPTSQYGYITIFSRINDHYRYANVFHSQPDSTPSLPAPPPPLQRVLWLYPSNVSLSWPCLIFNLGYFPYTNAQFFLKLHRHHIVSIVLPWTCPLISHLATHPARSSRLHPCALELLPGLTSLSRHSCLVFARI